MNHTMKLSGELTFDTVQTHHENLVNTLKDPDLTVLNLEMNEVTQCDSAGLALLIEAWRLCETTHRTLKLKGVSKKIHALAQFCGVENILHSKLNGFIHD